MSIGKLPRRPSGDSAAACYQQWVYDQQKEQKAGLITGQQTLNTTGGKFVFARRRGGSSSTTAATLILRLAEPDHLVCRDVSMTWLDTGKYKITRIGTADIFVAKPPELKCNITQFRTWAAGPAWATGTISYALDSSEPYMEWDDSSIWPDSTIRPDPGTDAHLNAFSELDTDYLSGTLFHTQNNLLRTVTVDGISADERVTPVWTKGDLIQVAELETPEVCNRADGFVISAGASVDFVAVNTGRVWARI